MHDHPTAGSRSIVCFRSTITVYYSIVIQKRRLVTYANNISLVNLNHFRLLRVVGRGAFGKVRIVERKDTNLSFALKYIRKDEGKLLSPSVGCTPGFRAMASKRVLLPSSAKIVEYMRRAIVSLVKPS